MSVFLIHLDFGLDSSIIFTSEGAYSMIQIFFLVFDIHFSCLLIISSDFSACISLVITVSLYSLMIYCNYSKSVTVTDMHEL